MLRLVVLAATLVVATAQPPGPPWPPPPRCDCDQQAFRNASDFVKENKCEYMPRFCDEDCLDGIKKLLNCDCVQKCQAPWIEQLKEKLAGAVKHWSDQCGNASEAVVEVAAGTLELTFKDCGVNAYAKVLTVAPNVLPLGKTTTISGTGQLSKDVAAASFDIQTTGITGSLGHCTSADASKPLTCALKVAGLPVGTMAYHGIPFPIKTGPLTGIPQLDITLPASLPSFASATTTTLKVTAANGDQVMCVQVFTKASSTATDTMKALRGAPTQIA